VPSLIKGRPNNNNTNTNNNKAKCIPGCTLRVLAGKKAVRYSTPSQHSTALKICNLKRQKKLGKLNFLRDYFLSS
jgi:hypothetical protein